MPRHYNTNAKCPCCGLHVRTYKSILNMLIQISINHSKPFASLVTVKGSTTLKYAPKHFLFGNPLNRSLCLAHAHTHGNDYRIGRGIAQIEPEQRLHMYVVLKC